MEAHDHEPSYYEVALTNRQVVSGFVILLVCLFGAFLGGVWLGRGGDDGGARSAAATPAPEAAPGEKRLEQLTFFGDRAGSPARPAATAPAAAPPAAAAPKPPERAAPTPAELEAEKLRQTLEAEMAQHRTDVGSASAETPAAPVGTRLRRRQDRPEPAAATAPVAAAPVAAAPANPAPAASAAAAPIWIQVYSSSNGAKAQELAGRLRQGSFQVVVLEAAGSGGATYRVRVGPYGARADADRAAARLRRDYRLDTWVTDQL